MSSKTLTADVSSPPATDELAPELEEPYRRLLRVLRGSTGMFALVPVESDLPRDDRDRLLERLRRDVDALGRELRVADLFYEQWDPLTAIEQAWDGVERPAVVVLRGLERTPPAPLGMGKDLRPTAFARLNQVREHLEQRFPEPLIVWCEPATFSALQRYAPDFFDHFAGLVRFQAAFTLEVREPKSAYGQPYFHISPPAVSHSALRFYEAQVAKSAPESQERAQALLGLAESLADLPGSEVNAAAEQTLAAIQEAIPLISPEGDPPQWARAQALQGRAYIATGDPRKARRCLSQALEVYRRLEQETPGAFEAKLASTLINLGNVVSELGDRGAARHTYKEALEIYRRLADQQPEAFQPDLALSLNNLGAVLSHLGDQDAAYETFEETLEIYRHLARSQAEAFEPDVAGVLNNLGILLRIRGKGSAARQAFEEALDIYRGLTNQHPTAYEPGLAMTLHNLGNLFEDLGDADAASRVYGEALGIYEPLTVKWPEVFGQDFVSTLQAYILIAPEDDKGPWQQVWADLLASGREDDQDAASS